MKSKLLVWGTGSYADRALKKELAPYLQDIIAFVDSNAKRRSLFYDKSIVSPTEALKLDYDLLIIASSYFPEIVKQAIDLGFEEKKIGFSTAFKFLEYQEKLSQQTLQALLKVPFWYHTYEILPGVMTPGRCPYKPELIENSLVQDLSGLRALDIGAWDGPYTLEMTRRGAKVTALDIQPPTHSGFDTMRRLNDLDVNHFCDSVYDLSPDRHGSYDLVTFFGVYYHLKNPLAAFSAINRVLPKGGLMLVEGAILEGSNHIDPFWKDREKQLEQMKGLPVAAYVKENYQGIWSNWWVPTLSCLHHWIESSGFEILESHNNLVQTRAWCVARKVNDDLLEHPILSKAPL
jgi:2-polyprenyl-3-methyl-5-hydroxy-6-metoxy-1,4-benzoquinol methylase